MARIGWNPPALLAVATAARAIGYCAAIDRATAQDLLKLSRVLADEAKKASDATCCPGDWWLGRKKSSD